MVRRLDGRRVNDLSPDSVIRSIAIASGLGTTSAYSWLKIPVVEDMERVAESFTLPALLLGGNTLDRPDEVFGRWQAALRLPNVHGLVAGRNLLYPPDDDVAAAVDLAVSLLPRQPPAVAAGPDRLAEAGFDGEIISGGGTGTYDLAAAAGALTEVQAGSYVLMDGRYGTLDLPFEQALYCVTTVISRRHSRAVLNAGLKELTVEYGMPAIQAAGARITALSDEHAQVRLAPGHGGLAVGDKVLLIPAHVDSAVNLYDRLFAREEGAVTEWDVDGRRRYRLPAAAG